jgi:hypothetical protein
MHTLFPLKIYGNVGELCCIAQTKSRDRDHAITKMTSDPAIPNLQQTKSAQQKRLQ